MGNHLSLQDDQFATIEENTMVVRHNRPSFKAEEPQINIEDTQQNLRL